MNIDIVRGYSTQYGTFGILYLERKPFCLTLEPIVPIIPEGSYTCKERWSEKRNTFVYEILNVPGHTYIQFHVGNLKNDTEGCILLGESFYTFKGGIGIFHSLVAFERFMAVTKGERLLLWISEPSSRR